MLRSEKQNTHTHTKKTLRIQQKRPILWGLPFLYFENWDVETITPPPPRGEGLTIHEPTNQGHSHGLCGGDMREMMIEILQEKI